MAAAWLVALATTSDPRPPILVAVAALAACSGPGRVAPRDLARGLLPLWTAALAVGLFNALLSPANADPLAPVVVAVGPVRVTAPAVEAGVALALRVVAIVAVGVAWAGSPTRPTSPMRSPSRLACPSGSPTGRWRRSRRSPGSPRTSSRCGRLAGCVASGRAGIPASSSACSCSAIRRADRLAVAMDARGFAGPRRTRYRLVPWPAVDAAVVAAGLVVLAAIVALR